MHNSFFGGFLKTLQEASKNLGSSLKNLFENKTKLSPEDEEFLEKILLKADLGVKTTQSLIKSLKTTLTADTTPIELLKKCIYEILLPCQHPLTIVQGKLNVILLCGTNGNGKTTTIGKLATKFGAQNHKVLIAACDTFRAGAIEQLKMLAEQSSADFFVAESVKDPASVAYLALQKAQKENYDLLLIDTSGRMGNNTNLMQELKKINKIMSNNLSNTTLKYNVLVLDASTGQNAFEQVATFKQSIDICGLILTKLDGSAKAGAIIGISNQYKLSIHFAGTGEKMQDLIEFNAKSFSDSLFAQ
jgi:fused signal recognition particle receptor